MSTTLEYQSTLKLRASCDACASSKVKCDKEQPACRRCVTAGNSCVYGISRKHGKQAHRRQIAAEPNAQHILAPKVHGPYDPNSCMSFDDLMQGMGLFGSMPQVATDEQEFYNCFPPQTPEEWSAFMDTTTTTATVSSVDIRHKHRPRSQGSKRSYDEAMTSKIDDAFSCMSSAYGTGEGVSSFSTPETFASQGLTGSYPDLHNLNIDSENHPCYSLASEALKLLNLEARFGCVIEPSDGGSSTTNIPLLNIAHILEANKAALNTLQRILDCPCSEHNAPLAFLNASIISKVNLWYRVGSNIIRSATGPPASLTRSTSDPTPLSNDPSMAQNQYIQAFSSHTLNSLPISVGAFDIDAEDRAALSRQLLLSELRKAARLVEKLQRGAADPSDDEVPSYRNAGNTDSVSSLYGMLGNWLKGEISRTMREVKREGPTTSCDNMDGYQAV